MTAGEKQRHMGAELVVMLTTKWLLESIGLSLEGGGSKTGTHEV